MQTSDKAKQTFSFYWRHAWNYPKYIIGLLIVVPLTILVNAYLPALIAAKVLSRLSQHDFSNDVWQSFSTEIIWYVALLIGGIFMWRIVDYIMWRLEGVVQRDLANESFSKLIDKSADFHANNFSGSLVSKNSKLLSSYVRIADTTVFQVYPLLSGLVIVSILLIGRAPLYVVLLLLFVSLYMIGALIASKPVRDKGAIHAESESTQTGFLADAIGNVMVIKSFARGSYERTRFGKATEKTHDSLMDMSRSHMRQMNTLGYFNRTISSTALIVAIVSVIHFNADIATVFLILSYTNTLIAALFDFGNSSLRNYNRSIGDSHEIISLLAEPPSIVDVAKPKTFKSGSGAIDFANVTFQHNGADDAIFKDFTLRIKPGEKVGLVGHSGSGKTTFTRLLMRFSDIQSGEILIDKQDISKIRQDDLHEAIAYVPQEPLLFHRTISENIGYGQQHASQNAIEVVAKIAHAHDFIAKLPQGYDTLVGERGVKLSGGQRQRIAIARALLKNAPILLLDEATSALDSESEALIQDALWKLMEGRTAIVIAHRLSTIQKMDRIVVLDNGKIVETGSHKELLNAHGAYAALWARQSGGFIED